MKYKFLLTFILIAVLFSCEKQSENTKIVQEFLDAYYSFGEDSIQNYYSDSVVFIYYSDLDLPDEFDTYTELLNNSLYDLGLISDERPVFKIDSISDENETVMVHQSFSSLLFEEMDLDQIQLIEKFSMRSGMINKVLLTKVTASDKISEVYEELMTWYRKFYNFNEHPYSNLWTGNEEAKYIKSTVNEYKKFLEFENNLKNDYNTSMSIDELARASFLNNDYHGKYFRFSMSFKEYEVSEEEPTDDFEDFLSYALFSSEGSDIFTIPRNHDFTEISELKPETSCYVYGKLTKFLTGELALEDVIIYTLK